MSTFKRTEKQVEKPMRGQALLVMMAVEALPEGATIEQLTPLVISAGLKTRQDPSRIVSYYLTIFKKHGLVTTVKPEIVVPVTDAPAVEAKTTEELIEEVTA